jgi:FG-GAP repeat
MQAIKDNRPTQPAGFRRRVVVLIAAIALLAGTVPVGSQTQTIQAIFNIDLGVSPSPANIRLLGASTDDHLSGNGTPNNFTSFPRAHAIAVGDFNHDGIQDMVVGAPDTDFTPAAPAAARANAGAVYITFGKSSFAAGTIIDTNLAAPIQPDIKIFGANADDNAGFAVAAGDVNGDGIDDLIIGAPGFDTTTGSPPTVAHQNAGAVYIIFGASTLSARTIDLAAANPVNVMITGENTGDLFGSALAVGDVNGGQNTTADLLVGAPGSSGPAPGTSPRVGGGAAFLLQGGSGLANTLATTRVIDLGATPATVRLYGKTGSQFGAAVAIGDVNSGGAADLIIGAPQTARPDQGGDVSDTGAVYVLFGGSNIAPVAPATSLVIDIAQASLTTQRVVIYGASSKDHLGASVAAGNIRGSGVVDLLMGAPDADGPADARTDAGEAYILSGGAQLNPNAGTAERRIDVSLGNMDLTVYGAAAGDHLGSTVAIGRINTQGNTDNTADVLIGAPGALLNKGAVHVFYGGPNLFARATSDLSLFGQNDLTITGEATGDELGWAIAAGDLDNNRGGDLILGAPFADITGRTNAGKVYVLLAAAENVPPVNQPPTVTVTRPNGGETFLGGLATDIDWTAADPDGNSTIDHFDIFLSTDAGATFNIKINTAGPVAGTARTFTWNVPTGLNTTLARVRVIATDTGGATGQDDSNANFTITDAGIGVQLTAPNGGEQIRTGSTFNITWTVPDALAAQVRGFDLFLTTDNGQTFSNITIPNPTTPALPGTARSFAWTPQSGLCTTTARVVIRATSVTGAQSTDQSDSFFSISNPGPTIDFNSDVTGFATPNKVLFSTTTPTGGTEIRFEEGLTVQISVDEAGTQFFSPSAVVIKKKNRRILLKGPINGQDIGVFWPDGATRIVRFTNPNCGLTVLRIKRVGDTFVLATTFDGQATESIP